MDYSQISLKSGERTRLFLANLKKSVKERFFGKYLSHLRKLGFIAPNYSGLDGYGVPIPNGTYSVTDAYDYYIIWRRDQFFRGSVWPAILSGAVSLIVSLLVAYFAK